MRYIAYSIIDGELVRVAVNQSSGEKAQRDAKNHSVRHGESWLYAADRGQILMGRYVNGSSASLSAPVVNQ